jgi:pimeloyl-ACP methyl ester carboxylesterase
MLGTNIIGAGPRGVLVLNDWLCDTSTWDPSRPYLDTEALTWVFADLRGYGRSRGQTGAFTVQEAARDVLDVADGLGWSRFAVVGHSMSTIVALHLGQIAATRIGRVVLTTPPPPSGFGYDEATHAALREVALGEDGRRARALGVMLGERLGAEWLRWLRDGATPRIPTQSRRTSRCSA